MLAVVFIVLAVLERYRAHTTEGILALPAVATVVAAVAVVVAVVSAIWVVTTGHLGAQITWQRADGAARQHGGIAPDRPVSGSSAR